MMFWRQEAVEILGNQTNDMRLFRNGDSIALGIVIDGVALESELAENRLGFLAS